MKLFLPVFIRALCSFAIGGLLVSNPQSMTSMIVQIIGGIFIFSGLIPILNYWMPSSQEQAIRPFFPVVGIGTAVDLQQPVVILVTMGLVEDAQHHVKPAPSGSPSGTFNHPV